MKYTNMKRSVTLPLSTLNTPLHDCSFSLHTLYDSLQSTFFKGQRSCQGNREQIQSMFVTYSMIESQESFPVNPSVWIWLWVTILLQSSCLKRAATENHHFSASLHCPFWDEKNFNEVTIEELDESCQVFQHPVINSESDFNIIIWELLN